MKTTLTHIGSLRSIRQTLFIGLICCGISGSTYCQSVYSSGGGYYEQGNISISYTIGEAITSTYMGTNNTVNQGFQQVYDSIEYLIDHRVKVKLFLQGAYVSNMLMRTSLSQQGLLPLSQPYNTPPWNYAGTEAFSSIPANAVDWILLELRSTTDTFLARRAGLLLDNGIIIDTDYAPGLRFDSIVSGSYFIVADHRNHMPVMSAQTVVFPNSFTYDFSQPAFYPALGGTQAQFSLFNGPKALVAGDISANLTLKYSGVGNDRVMVFQRIYQETGSTAINTTVDGYYPEDINLDGTVKYTGISNDPSNIIQGLIQMTGSTAINSTYTSPVPEGHSGK